MNWDSIQLLPGNIFTDIYAGHTYKVIAIKVIDDGAEVNLRELDKGSEIKMNMKDIVRGVKMGKYKVL